MTATGVTPPPTTSPSGGRERLLDRFGFRDLGAGASLTPLLVLLGLSIVDEIDESAFNVLGPNIRDAFHLSNTGYVLVRTGIIPLLLLAGLGIGYLADRRKRTALAAAGTAAVGVFGLLLGLGPAFVPLLIVFRVGAGLGRQTNRPTHQSLMADLYPPAAWAGVFSLWRLANPVGLMVGPLLAGGLASITGSWRVPFLVLAVPAAIASYLGFRLTEPVRGVQDRRAAGGDEAAATTEEVSPSWEESWRTLNGIQTLRRVWRALPFLIGGVLGIAVLLPLYYDQVFHASDAARGIVAASVQPFHVIGLIAGIPMTAKLLRTRPARVLHFFALAATAGAGGLLIVAAAPNLFVAAVGSAIASMTLAVLVPGFGALTSLIVPPRSRGLSFSVIELWSLPGLVFVVIATRVGDAYGLRWGVAVMTGVFLLGGYIVASAGGKVSADIVKARTSSLAQAEARLARQRGDAKLLICRGIDVRYGQVQVLFGVDFEVGDGEIVALLGTNGAGKSTLLKAICGLVDPSAGAIVFDGRDATHTTPQLALSRGIALMPGGRGVFPSLTVAENLDAAAWLTHGQGQDEIDSRRAQALERFPRLAERLDQPAGQLSGGEQQMLALSMAFLAKPRLLLIDELSLGLAPVVVEQLLGIVRAIHEGGTTVILVEQSVNVALTVAQRAVFMEKGEVRFEGPTADLLGRDDVLRSVFLEGAAKGIGAGTGRPRDGAAGRRRRHDTVLADETTGIRQRSDTQFGPGVEGGGADTLTVVDVARTYGGIRAVDGVSLRVAPGEVVGLIGANGAGKTTLFDLISGYVTTDSGQVVLGGVDVTSWRPDARSRARLGRSFQDAALFPSLTVRETIALAHDGQLRCRDPLSAVLALPDQRVEESLLRSRVDDLIDLVGVGAFADKFVGELSTGSRRIVDLACALAHDPVILLLDEPSSGIAQREAEALAPLLLSIRDATGMAMLIIEHDMPLINAVSDRLYALERGRVIAEGDPTDVIASPLVVASYLGTDPAAIDRSGTAANAALSVLSPLSPGDPDA